MFFLSSTSSSCILFSYLSLLSPSSTLFLLFPSLLFPVFFLLPSSFILLLLSSQLLYFPAHLPSLFVPHSFFLSLIFSFPTLLSSPSFLLPTLSVLFPSSSSHPPPLSLFLFSSSLLRPPPPPSLHSSSKSGIRNIFHVPL